MASLLAVTNASAKTYTAAQSGKFTDEKIWQPAYPGNSIQKGDTIIISSHVVLNTPLTISGVAAIQKGASLQGNKDVALNESGKIFNLGNTVVRRLQNQGQLDNQMVFETMFEMQNSGIIHNNSTTVAGTSMVNENGVLAGNKGSYFTNSMFISSPGSIHENGIKVFEAAYTNPMAEIDEAIYCNALISAMPTGKNSVRIEIQNAHAYRFTKVVLERSDDGNVFRPFAEINFNDSHSKIEDFKASANNYYRAVAFDASGKKYRLPETFVKNSAADETLSMASRISF